MSTFAFPSVWRSVQVRYIQVAVKAVQSCGLNHPGGCAMWAEVASWWAHEGSARKSVAAWNEVGDEETSACSWVVTLFSNWLPRLAPSKDLVSTAWRMSD